MGDWSVPARPGIVCICGSARFVAEMRGASRDLTLRGIVLAPAEMDGDVSADQKAHLDALHRHKIDLADRVLVVNPGGYIGASTAAEIAYARRDRHAGFLHRSAGRCRGRRSGES
jgi:hypothetical protein